ncbi:hypothetical protein [Georgenia yuyongxinii]|uniref:Uncharacterized protein n=1 Tax=Georgenia yuyongxinii TaxID=2589797 RepID=A0A552WWF4_9MICO|nr:hypothetical protein [Georgenia yuyongxinii]TRW47160.1 hypothetical protein FJ693_02715 [Georgenia yuyongxinii]
MERFNFWPVLYGHWKALRPEGNTRLDPRAVFIGIPGLLMALSLSLKWELSAPAALLTAVSLLIGGALTVFAQMIGLRTRIRDDLDPEWVAARFDALDETVNHLLSAVLVAIADAVLLVIYMNVVTENSSRAACLLLGRPLRLIQSERSVLTQWQCQGLSITWPLASLP